MFLGCLVAKASLQVKSSLLYCQFFHMYSTYIQRIEIEKVLGVWGAGGGGGGGVVVSEFSVAWVKEWEGGGGKDGREFSFLTA